MQSSHFGPIWETMFLSGMGYHLNPEKCEIKDREYKKFFELFGSTIACSHCRDSYKVFFKELPIESFMREEWGLVKWVYLMKEKVNNKLKKQEQESLQKEFVDMTNNKEMYPGGENDAKFWKDFREKAQKMIYTKCSPSYFDVLQKYLNLRADCSGPAKNCRTPLNQMESEAEVNLIGGKKRKSRKRKVTSRKNRSKFQILK